MSKASKSRALGQEDVTLAEHMTTIGRIGGRSKSRKKLKAIRDNLRVAMAARFPNSAKWNPGRGRAAGTGTAGSKSRTGRKGRTRRKVSRRPKRRRS